MKTPKKDTRTGPASLFIKDGKIVRRHPKHKPWNAAPKTMSGFGNRESYGKKFGEFVTNYDTVPRSQVKKEWKQEIQEDLVKDNEEEFEVYPVTCSFCKTTYPIRLRPSDVKRYEEENLLVQQAFPYLSVDERELLISGMCGICFDKALTPKTKQ